MKLFAFGEGDLHFNPLTEEVDFGGDTGHALGFCRSLDFGDFLFVEKELPWARLEVIGDVAVGVGADVNFPQHGDKARDVHPTIGEVTFTRTEAFDLGSGQGNTSLPRVTNVVLMIGFAIGGDDFDARFVHLLILSETTF